MFAVLSIRNPGFELDAGSGIDRHRHPGQGIPLL